MRPCWSGCPRPFSFNDSSVPVAWKGFTLEWYRTLLGDRALMEALGRGEEILEAGSFQRQVYPHADEFQGTLYSQSGVHWLPPDTIEFWVEDRFEVTSWS